MNNIVYISNTAIITVLKLSAVPVACATFVGLIVGLFQTVMQVQEQTLPFGLKMLTVFMCIFMLTSWFSAEMLTLATQAFKMAFN